MNRRAILIAVCSAVILVVGMQAAINLAVPGLAAGDLHPSASQLLWIVDAYVIVFASLLIPGGALGDRYGRRGALVAGVALFALGCTICALAPGVEILLAGRAVTGVGALLLVGGLVLLVGAIIEGPSHGWGSATVLGAFAGSAVVLTLFTRFELRREHPVLDPRVFTLAAVRLPCVIVALLFVGMFGLFYVNASYLEQAKGYSALATGFALAPMALGMVVAARQAVRAARRLGERTTLVIGLLLVASGLFGFSLDGAGTPYLVYLLPLLLLAAGFGLCLPVLSNAIVGAMPAHHAGLGSGLNGATREVGSALGVALVGTILSDRFTARTGLHGAPGAVLARHPQLVGDFTAAMAAGIRVVAAAVLVGALVTAVRFTGAARARVAPSQA